MERERTLLRLKPTDTGDRITGVRDARPRPILPASVQRDRLGAKIERIEEILQRREGDFEVYADPGAVSPEHALVFEIYGSINDFSRTAARVGLEWLAEQVVYLTVEEDLIPHLLAGDEDEPTSEADDEAVGEVEAAIASLSGREFLNEATGIETVGRLYVGMPTKEALQAMLTLWGVYKDGKSAPKNYSDWWQLFGKLKDLRRWGPQDRVDPFTRDYLARELARRPTGAIELEVDLWFRDRPAADSEEALSGALATVGGEILDRFRLPDIKYHGVLIRVPIGVAGNLVTLDSPLAVAEEIMSIRPQSMARAEPLGVDPAAAAPARPAPQAPVPGPTLAALIDGYPVQNHDLLRNRVDITPVDVLPESAPVAQRYHGTVMASLILHGDLAHNEPPINRMLHVVPVLEGAGSGHEVVPPSKLPVAMIYRAVKALKEGEAGTGPAAPHVLLINHSLADEAQPFAGRSSAWARMLDYLSWNYNVLFIVSAGNIRDAFDVPYYASVREFQAADPVEREGALLISLERSKAKRGLLPPAESINALSVGSLHSDGTGPMPNNVVDPFPTSGMINLCSGLGLGVASSIKPDLVYDGGRQVAHPAMSSSFNVHGRMIDQVGQLTAVPDPAQGALGKVRRSSGTSNSAALITRAGLKIADALDLAFADEDPEWFKRRTAAAMLKALIAHGCSWSSIGRILDNSYGPKGNPYRRRENIARYLGYGRPDVDRVLSGTANRVTLLADGEIRPNKRHEYHFPLPPELSGRKDVRRLALTLAWISPVRHNAQNYREIGMELVSASGRTNYWAGARRIDLQPPVNVGRRGTVLHTVLEGDSAVAFTAGGNIAFEVQARSPYTGVGSRRIPYALAVTLEVADTIATDIYQSVRTQLTAARVTAP